MKNQNAIKRSRLPLIIATCGSFLLGAVTLVAVMISNPDDFYGFAFWVCVPSALLRQLAQFDTYPKDSIVNGQIFIDIAAVVINTLLGAMIFGLVPRLLKYLWTFLANCKGFDWTKRGHRDT